MSLPEQSEKSALTSSLGTLVVATAQDQLVGLWFAGSAHLPPQLDQVPCVAPNALMQRVQAQLNAYLAGQRTTFDLPLAPPTGTPLQRQVWQALATLPYGSTCSYTDLATRVGRPSAARAVAAAVARNPLHIVLPCHRVVGANGSLTGYAGGLQRKAALLQLEGAL